MARNQFDVLKGEFQNECKIINSIYEYEGYIGNEKGAIISELSEKEILEKYKPFVQEYIPFFILPPMYGEVRQQFRRNENKHYMRMVRGHFYPLEEDLEEHHPEIAIEDCAAQIFAQEQNRELWIAIDSLNEKQRKRFIAYYFEGKAYREIADEEGVDHKTINHSVEIALEKLRIPLEVELTEYIGFVDSEYLLRKINIGLKKALGLWVDKPQKQKGDIRCLCSKCLEDYKSNPSYIVRRLDPCAKEKCKCDKCLNMGYDYLIYDKRISRGNAYGRYKYYKVVCACLRSF